MHTYIHTYIHTYTSVSFQSEPEFRERAYVTDEDIKVLNNFTEKTVMAIKAPKGTKMALPYPDPNAEQHPG
jgi:hypothetical protein